MHPTGRPSSSAPADAPSSSPKSPPRRRQRVDSNPQLVAYPGRPDAKRQRPSPPANMASKATASTSASATADGVEYLGSTPRTRPLHPPPPPLSSSQHQNMISTFRPHAGAKRLVIRNLRTAPRLHEIDRYYERAWSNMRAGTAAILAGQQTQQPLETLYRSVEDLCLHGKEMQLYTTLREQVEQHLLTVVLPRIESSIAATSSSDNLNALRIVHKEWNTWCDQAVLIRSTFSYLDRTYLLNNRSLQRVNDMLIYWFRRMVFGGKKSEATGTKSSSTTTTTTDIIASLQGHPGQQVLLGVIDLVGQYRRGEADSDKTTLLREATTMLRVFGVYLRYFEPALLQRSELYFQSLARDRYDDAATTPLPLYIRACSDVLAREETMCHTFHLDSSTKTALLNMAYRLLVVDKVAKLVQPSDIARLLDDNDVASMSALFRLLRVPKLHLQLRKPWEAYIEAAGRTIVVDVAHGDEMIVRLLLLYRRMEVLARDGFRVEEGGQGEGDAGATAAAGAPGKTKTNKDDFLYSLRDAFGRFMNDQAVAEAWSAKDASKVGEMLAKYMDLLLRGGLKMLPEALRSDRVDRLQAERNGQASTADEDAELDRQLDQALVLFRFLEGKDVFEAFYKRDLARRLLMGRSASQDAERNMLAKLKTECGSSLTHNLEQMFRDQELSRDEMTAYRNYVGGLEKTSSSKVDLQVSVLSAAAWPTYHEVDLHLPPEVLDQVQRFDKYYQAKHTGRILTWMHTLGHCVVQAAGFDKGGPKELHVSAFQATVLMLFNDESTDALTYRQIADATGLAGAELDRTLQSLACGKVRVLTKRPKGRDVQPTDTFVFNRAFVDPRVRIKINQIQLKETKAENKAVYERVAVDRQFETQAAIVRIMKSRKTLPHAQLVAEVINQTKARGALDPAEIKQNIEKLIEKDYIDREDGNYVYLA